MDSETAKAGDVVLEVNAAEVVKSAGIQLAVWADALLNTDAAYSENWIETTVERMATLSELCYILFNESPEALRAIKMALPEGFIGHVTKNPLIERKDVEAGNDTLPASDNGMGELPF